MPWLDWVYLAGMVLALPLAAFCTLRPLPARLLWPAGVLAAGWVALAVVVAVGPTAVDFTIFWAAGGDVLAGTDPYVESVTQNRPFFNPPPALTLFAGLAFLPQSIAFAVWEAFNIAAGLSLIPLARWAARDPAGGDDPLTPTDAVALAAAVGFCNAFRSNLLLGQMAVLAAIALVVAVGSWRRGWVWLTAAALAVATVKVGTALPFLLLLHRRRDWPVWVLGGAMTFLLCVPSGSVMELPDRCRRLVENIGQYSSPGFINDYSDAGPHSADIVGYDKLLYHLGVTDRTAVRIGQVVILTLILLGLAWEVFVRKRLPEAAVGPLLAVVGVVFLYHRNYDTVLLFLPLVYAVGRARLSAPRAKWLYRAAAWALLLVLFMPRKLLEVLIHHPVMAEPAMIPVRALVLPISTWLITAALGLLWVAARQTPVPPLADDRYPAPATDGGTA